MWVRVEDHFGTLSETLSRSIEDYLLDETDDRTNSPTPVNLAAVARAIAQQLVDEAIRTGFSVTPKAIASSPAGEGSTADRVERLRMSLSFFFKLHHDASLIEEARLLKWFAGPDAPPSFRGRFPAVYATRSEPPYAYLMEDFAPEDGYSPLSRILFSSGGLDHAHRLHLIDDVLDVMLGAYGESLSSRLLPSIEQDYVTRISSRLADAAGLERSFRPRDLQVNGEAIASWDRQVALIRNYGPQSVAPPFVCTIHGDPNPENILLLRGEQLIVKFIDPKPWERGDYIFDLTKLAHYLLVTGPVELSDVGTVEQTEGILKYRINCEPWVSDMVEHIRKRAIVFGAQHADKHVAVRWELGMASGLLGAVKNRWESGQDTSARILYGAGMEYLNRFVQGLAALELA